MATGEHGLLGLPAPNLAPVELSLEPDSATIRHQAMQELAALDLKPDHKIATPRPALQHLVKFKINYSKIKSHYILTKLTLYL